ncbi:MAG: hypothetical protein ACTS3F_01710 [Phycisphaerales bacterium]
MPTTRKDPITPGLAAILLAIAGGQARHAGAQVCGPSWLPGDGVPGLDSFVFSIASFDPDGPGPQPEQLIAGGSFEIAGSASAQYIAAWDGANWIALNSPGGAGLDLWSFDAVVFDDGSGPALFVAGVFTVAGGSTANFIAKWDGQAWATLSGPSGTGMDAPVSALAVFDAGTGPALYAAGSFTTAGGVPANRIARWDGSNWSPFPGSASLGFDDSVQDLLVHDDGTGPALYAAGMFTLSGATALNRIARWDGSGGWTALSGPIGTGMDDDVWILAEHDDGSGPALYAGGEFGIAGGLAANNIAKWNGTAWSTLAGPAAAGVSGDVRGLASYDADAGGPIPPALIVGGWFTSAGGVPANYIARWSGTAWSPLNAPGGQGMNSGIYALKAINEGSASTLYAAGDFTAAGGKVANRIASWNGSDWQPLAGTGVSGPNDQIEALALHAGHVYAGGQFTDVNAQTANQIARWDGIAWEPLVAPGGIGTNGDVLALTVHNDGTGDAIYAGGQFTTAGGVTVNRIAKWTGSTWQPLAGPTLIGMNFNVYALESHAGELFAGGSFVSAGGVTVNRIARWNGSAWAPLSGPAGTGVAGGNIVRAIVSHNDGSGPAIYAGGNFTVAGGLTVNRIARWTPAGWSALTGPAATGMNDNVNALVVFDDGAGPALYAGGLFTTAGGVTVNHIARWNGFAWQALTGPAGTGVNDWVTAMAVHDDGDGPALYVAGEFTQAGGIAVDRIARWDGIAWSSVDIGVDDGVNALISYDPDALGPANPRLLAGGDFSIAGGEVSAFFAQFGEDSNIWAQPFGGQFDEPSSWLCNRPLSPFDAAFFDATIAGYTPSAFSLAFPGDPEPKLARSLRMRTDIVTLNLAGQSLLLTESSTTIARPSLVVGELAGLGSTLTIRNFPNDQPAASVTAGALSIGDQPTTGPSILNRLQVQDEDSALVIHGDAYIGRRADAGELIVQGKAYAALRGTISIGAEPGSGGTIIVRNPQTLFEHSSPLPAPERRSMAIGESGTGALIIGGAGPQAGATARTFGRMDTITLGTNAGASGLVRVEGLNSRWEIESERLQIGLHAAGTLDIRDGARVESDTLNGVQIGFEPDGQGIVSLTGALSQWFETSSAINIGPNGAVFVGEGASIDAVAINVLPGGALEGDGQIGGGSTLGLTTNVTNLGTVRPGNGEVAGGTLTIVGDYRQVGPPPGGGPEQAGRLIARIDASGAADRLVVLGNADLRGGLFIEIDPEAEPALAQSFEVFSTDTPPNPGAEQFGVALMPGLTDGKYMRLNYTSSDAGEGVDGPSAQSAIVSVELLSALLGFGDPDSIPIAGQPTDLAVADINADALDDIIVTLTGPSPASPGSVLVLTNLGDGTAFASQQFPTGPEPTAIAIGEFDPQIATSGLGGPDIAISCSGDDTVRVLSNTGGSFVDSPFGPIPVGAAPSDIVADEFLTPGVIDLFVANLEDGTIQRLANNGAGLFTPQAPIAIGTAPIALASADLDNSGLPDLAVALGGEDSARPVLNAGSGSFIPQAKIPVGTNPAGIGIEELEFDKDLDTRPTIIVINGGSNSASIIEGDGAGAFAPAVDIPLGGQPISQAAWDMDEDGDTDLAFVVIDEEAGRLVRILRNDTEPDSGQIVLAPADDVAEGEEPILVDSGEMDTDPGEEIVTINQTGAALNAPAANTIPPATNGPLASLSIRPPIRTNPPICPGDLNNDREVNSDDLAILLSAFGTSPDGDLNSDGKTNSDDLGILLSAFGSQCN